jgi:hypothetical protein
MSIPHIWSAIVLGILTIGILKRHQQTLHIKLMATAMVLDLALVGYIEFNRKAIATAMQPPHPFVTFHVVMSVIVVLLYFVQAGLGRKLKNGDEKLRKFHKWSGWTLYLLRWGNFITSFFVGDFIHHPAA